jgi:hypothetical protein
MVEWRYSSTHPYLRFCEGHEWSDLAHDRFAHRERAVGTHWLCGVRAMLDVVVNEIAALPGTEPRSSNP